MKTGNSGKNVMPFLNGFQKIFFALGLILCLSGCADDDADPVIYSYDVTVYNKTDIALVIEYQKYNYRLFEWEPYGWETVRENLAPGEHIYIVADSTYSYEGDFIVAFQDKRYTLSLLQKYIQFLEYTLRY